MDHVGERVRRGRVGIMAMAIAFTLGGCDEWKPPSPPPVAQIPVYPGPPAHPAKKHAGKPANAFKALSDRLLDQWLADEPSMGRVAGLHRFDGKVADYSAA